MRAYIYFSVYFSTFLPENGNIYFTCKSLGITVGDTNFNKVVLFFGGFETPATLQFFAPRAKKFNRNITMLLHP